MRGPAFLSFYNLMYGLEYQTSRNMIYTEAPNMLHSHLKPSREIAICTNFMHLNEIK